MVEGPGCKLKGEKIKARLLKQHVKGVNGNAFDREEKMVKKKQQQDTPDSGGPHVAANGFQQLIGRSLDEVLTLGKELFMFFGNTCLRIHFLMAGSFRVNDVQVDTDGGKKIPASASLEIQFSKDKLTFYKCAAEIRPSSACRQKHLNLKDLDICSPTFSHKRAVREMMLEDDRQLCDVLLDQEVLPGVGNIIKNEALFDSGLKPDSKIRELSEEHISHLVKMTRDFSLLFYECRKTGTNLRQYMKVYQKGTCGECSTKIVMTRMGEDSERVTFFCPSCQKNDIKQRSKLKLPTKNSLLGWVQTDHNKSEPKEWACSHCTLLNPANYSNCTMCMKPRHSPAKTAADPGQGSVKLQQTLSSLLGKRKLAAAEAEQSASSHKRLKGDESKSSCHNTPKACHDADTLDGDLHSKIPACRGHGVQCAMRQTFKDNENKGRWFFTCAAAPASKRCNFFQWADDGFPICSGHGKACALRTVMKQGVNNGRRFFCCPLKRNGCRFFEWAVGYG